MQIPTVKLSREGCVLIPAEVRAAMGLSEGSHLSLAVQDGEIRLFDRTQALPWARAEAPARLVAYRQSAIGKNTVAIRKKTAAPPLELWPIPRHACLQPALLVG